MKCVEVASECCLDKNTGSPRHAIFCFPTQFLLQVTFARPSSFQQHQGPSTFTTIAQEDTSRSLSKAFKDAAPRTALHLRRFMGGIRYRWAAAPWSQPLRPILGVRPAPGSTATPRPVRVRRLPLPRLVACRDPPGHRVLNMELLARGKDRGAAGAQVAQSTWTFQSTQPMTRRVARLSWQALRVFQRGLRTCGRWRSPS